MDRARLLFSKLHEDSKQFAKSLGHVCYNNILQIPRNYNLNILLRIINYNNKANKDSSELHILMEPFEFLEVEACEYSVLENGLSIKSLLKPIKVTKNSLVNGLIQGYFAYYQKKSKQQKNERSEILYTHDESNRTMPIHNGFTQITDNNFIKPGSFRSTYIFGPQLTQVRNKLINLYLSMVVPEYREIVIPKFTSEKIFAKSNHIRLPQHTYLVAKILPEKIAKCELNGYLFKDWRISNTEVKLAGVSTYGVCEPFWSYLENTRIDSKQNSFRYFDKSGFSLRNEGNAIKGLERLDAFSRIELIFIEQSAIALDEYIQGYLEKMKSFLNFIDLKYRILKVDSWTAVANNAATRVKTYDFEAYLEYKDQWLEICNISNNGIIFSSAFNVRDENNQFIHTGCGGLGIERILYVSIEQKGYKHILSL